MKSELRKLGLYELNRIYTGDAAELMAALPDGCIDLTVTSPPYDNLRDYKGYTFDFEPIAAQLFRVTKLGGVVVWVVGDATVNGSETGTSFRQALGFMELGLRLHDTMIYQKCSPHPPNVRYWQEFEYMFILSKGRPATFSPLQQPKKSSTMQRQGGAYNRFTRTVGGKISPLSQAGHKRMKEASKKTERIRSNVWRYTTGGSNIGDSLAHKHPAAFPEALARDHILSWSNPGDVVLDPMCGSGTTLKMAKQTGRRWLAFDIAEEYVELARQRVAQANPPLFVL